MARYTDSHLMFHNREDGDGYTGQVDYTAAREPCEKSVRHHDLLLPVIAETAGRRWGNRRR
ncbi:MAG TPA: hypothetical protein VFP84_01680 [Kofleriaceae bacterium]|nr:hypothetical protein [Kofleriaceae bacterium]